MIDKTRGKDRDLKQKEKKNELLYSSKTDLNASPPQKQKQTEREREGKGKRLRLSLSLNGVDPKGVSQNKKYQSVNIPKTARNSWVFFLIF